MTRPQMEALVRADSDVVGDDAAQAELIAQVVATRPFVVEDATVRSLHFSYASIQSAMDLQDPYALVAAYTREMMVFLLLMPMPRHVVLIGLGGGSLVKFCHQHLPLTRLTAVEIDAEVLALRDRFQVPADDARLRILHQDGAAYLRAPGERADAILVDAFDDKGVAPAFAAPEAYEGAFGRLSADGVLVMNLAGPASKYIAPIENIRRAFGALRVMPVSDDDNLLLIAAKRPAIMDLPEFLDRRALSLQQHLGLDFTGFLQHLRDSPRVRCTQDSTPQAANRR